MGTGVRLDTAPPLRSQNGYVVLLDENSTSQQSSVITIRDTPVVIQAFGLLPGETITVHAVHTWLGIDYSQPFKYLGLPLILDSTNTAQKLAITGTYRLVFDGILGNLTAISIAQSRQDARRRENVPDSQPYGDQVNRPNTYFDSQSVSNTSQIVEIIDTPWIFNGYNIPNGQQVTVYSVFGRGVDEVTQPYLFDGAELKLTQGINSILLEKSGRYKFVYTGTVGSILLAGMQMPISFDDPQAQGPQGIQGAIGEQGIQGIQGLQGVSTTWRTAAGVPSNALGVNGDYYLNSANSDVYEKSGGAYATVANIRGLQGIQGIQGIQGAAGVVQSIVAGTNVTVNNTDPANPIVSAAGVVQSIVAGTNVTVNSTDPANPIVSAAGVVQSIVAGTNVTVDNTDPANPIVSAAGGGGSQSAIQFKDEGTNLGASGTADTVNFVGAGVTATRVGNVVTATIAGGGGSYPAHAEWYSTTAQSTTATFPLDTTIPQKTEGAAVTGATVTIVVASAASNILLTCSISQVTTDIANSIGVHFFRDAAADAVGGTFKAITAGGANDIKFSVIVPAGSSGSTTFTLRYGGQSGVGATVHLASFTGTQYHGAANQIIITAQELPP